MEFHCDPQLGPGEVVSGRRPIWEDHGVLEHRPGKPGIDQPLAHLTIEPRVRQCLGAEVRIEKGSQVGTAVAAASAESSVVAEEGSPVDEISPPGVVDEEDEPRQLHAMGDVEQRAMNVRTADPLDLDRVDADELRGLVLANPGQNGRATAPDRHLRSAARSCSVELPERCGAPM